jgi:type II secretory pathway pseudopilin PulG
MQVHFQRSGYTLRELLAVVTLFCLLLAIIVPSVRAGRENALRMQCSNNLRQTGLSLQNYHDTFRQFPPGALHSGMAAEGDPPINAGLGPSWWCFLIPFQQKGTLYGELQLARQVPGTEFTADSMTAAGLPAGLLTGEYYMLCPASPLPHMESPTGPILLPSYVGIAGGCDIDPGAFETRTVRQTTPDMVLSGANWLYHNRAKGTGAAVGGIVTSSGMLPPCQSVRMSDCTDGVSNTMIVAEQSDWLRDRDRASGQKYRGDAGWTVGGTGAGGGFLSGTRRVDPVPEVIVPGGPPSPWGADCWNLTVVRYPPNRKHVLGPSPLPGCSENHGINNPLQSAHRGGLFVAMVDGSVHFLEDRTDLEVILRLAIRDDSPDD